MEEHRILNEEARQVVYGDDYKDVIEELNFDDE